MFKPCGNSRLKFCVLPNLRSTECSYAYVAYMCQGNYQNAIATSSFHFQAPLKSIKSAWWQNLLFGLERRFFQAWLPFRSKKASPRLTAGSSKTCAFNPEILQSYKAFLGAHAVTYSCFVKDMMSYCLGTLIDLYLPVASGFFPYRRNAAFLPSCIPLLVLVFVSALRESLAYFGIRCVWSGCSCVFSHLLRSEYCCCWYGRNLRDRSASSCCACVRRPRLHRTCSWPSVFLLVDVWDLFCTHILQVWYHTITSFWFIWYYRDLPRFCASVALLLQVRKGFSSKWKGSSRLHAASIIKWNASNDEAL